MGKKAKQHRRSQADRERAIEANYFARKCGLTKKEALKILKEAAHQDGWRSQAAV